MPTSEKKLKNKKKSSSEPIKATEPIEPASEPVDIVHPIVIAVVAC
jgi:hypothetical protein